MLQSCSPFFLIFMMANKLKAAPPFGDNKNQIQITKNTIDARIPPFTGLENSTRPQGIVAQNVHWTRNCLHRTRIKMKEKLLSPDNMHRHH